jgi:SAM-dependent methyltransferase
LRVVGVVLSRVFEIRVSAAFDLAHDLLDDGVVWYRVARCRCSRIRGTPCLLGVLYFKWLRVSPRSRRRRESGGNVTRFDSRRLHCTKNRLRQPVRERTFSAVAESERLAARAETLDYRLAAAGREAAEDERLGLLEQIYDPISRSRRALVQPGWRCLEVGAGRGSMVAWLAEQVGATGHVVATDVDTRYLSRLELPNVEVIEHNILEDPIDVLRPGSFDLVCSRLMLFHLEGRQEQAISQMAECLRPGGWLLDEDADWGTAAHSSEPRPALRSSARYRGRLIRLRPRPDRGRSERDRAAPDLRFQCRLLPFHATGEQGSAV